MPHEPAHEPTPAEIAAKCAEIQATWTEAERLKRLGKCATKARQGEYKILADEIRITNNAIDCVIPTK